MAPFETVKALAFDIQGTVVDFYGPLMRRGQSINEAKGLSVDWHRIAQEWRRLYREAMDDVIGGRRSWLPADKIYREALDILLETEELAAQFSSDERDALNAVWSALDPWPDSVEGLTRLRRRFTLAMLSNATMAALVRVARHAGLTFDAVLSAELADCFKPAPAVYQLAVDYLGYHPHEIMMVACHTYDLDAAAAFGMRTAFVARPLEFGPTVRQRVPDVSRFDVAARDLTDLAGLLEANLEL